MALLPTLSQVPFISIAGSNEYRTLISNFDNLGREHRKRKWLYPRRMIGISYSNITDAELTTLLEFQKARFGEFQAFTFIMPSGTSETYYADYVGTGDASQVLFNIPCVSTSRTIYIGGVQANAGSDYTFNATAGLDGVDSITFAVAPLAGVRITADFTGRLAIRGRFAESISYERVHFRLGLNNCSISISGLLIDD